MHSDLGASSFDPIRSTHCIPSSLSECAARQLAFICVPAKTKTAYADSERWLHLTENKYRNCAGGLILRNFIFQKYCLKGTVILEKYCERKRCILNAILVFCYQHLSFEMGENIQL